MPGIVFELRFWKKAGNGHNSSAVLAMTHVRRGSGDSFLVSMDGTDASATARLLGAGKVISIQYHVFCAV